MRKPRAPRQRLISDARLRFFRLVRAVAQPGFVRSDDPVHIAIPGHKGTNVLDCAAPVAGFVTSVPKIVPCYVASGSFLYCFIIGVTEMPCNKTDAPITHNTVLSSHSA